MKTRTQNLLLALVLLSTLNSQLSTVFAQGSLTPPGAPAPTMKTLAQIEPRTPISSAPFYITAPGAYYLTTNLTVTSGDAITIAANGVTLDLNGFNIASTAPSVSGNGILINSGLRNLAILNGFIQGGMTNNGSGVYSGSGFGYGIHGDTVQNARVSGVSVSGCLYDGINLGSGDSTVVDSCTVRTVGGNGIVASTIRASMAKDCGGDGIHGDQAADCRGESTGSGYGLNANRALNGYGYSVSSHGVVANTALNCYGYSSSGTGLNASTAENCQGGSTSGVGLNANTALNCYGSSSSGTGLNANTALNCQGSSSSDIGLNATMAQNCQGSSDYIGLHATVAQNCYGTASGAGIGLYAIYIAIGCYGVSSSGTGLIADIANSSFGQCPSGIPQSINYKYNMP